MSSKRGRKTAPTLPTQNNSILNFFQSKTDQSPESIVRPIIVDTIYAAVDKAEGVKTSAKKHDGNKVSKKTYDIWKKSFPWLEFVDTESDKRLKCAYCTQFNFKNVWSDEGTPNVQRSSVERHSESKDHISAEKLYLNKNVDFDIKCDETVTSVSDPDMFLFRTIYSLAKNEIPSEKVNDMLELQTLNKVDMQYKNLSWTTISDIQQCISTVLKTAIVNEINDSKYFSLMLDESTDIAIEKHLAVCIRYVKDGEPVTKNLANVSLLDGCATSIVNATYNCLKELGVNMSYCVSLATDGASVMLGKKTGVGVQMQAKYTPFAIQTHCFAHRLNLALTDSIKKNEILLKFRDKFSGLYHFMRGSSKRTSTLKSIQQILDEPELAIKEPHSIRWLGLKNAVYAVFMCYGSVLATLSKFANDNDASAKGLHKYFCNYKVALLIAFMLDIHSELAVLSCHLQKQDLLFSEIPPLVDSTLGNLEVLKTNDGDCLVEMRQAIEISGDKASYKGEDLKNYGKHIDLQFETVKLEYIKNISKNIKQRFVKESTQVLGDMAHVFEPITVQFASDSENEAAVESLGNFYGSEKTLKVVHGDLQVEGLCEKETVVAPMINKAALLKEWPGFCAMMKGSFSKLTVSEICKRMILLHHSIYPNITILAKVALCLMVTSVECERTFSFQNRLKNKFRSSLKSEKLDLLLNIILCGPMVSDFDPTPACKLWLASKNRRKRRLMQEYKPRKRLAKDKGETAVRHRHLACKYCLQQFDS